MDRKRGCGSEVSRKELNTITLTGRRGGGGGRKGGHGSPFFLEIWIVLNPSSQDLLLECCKQNLRMWIFHRGGEGLRTRKGVMMCSSMGRGCAVAHVFLRTLWFFPFDYSPLPRLEPRPLKLEQTRGNALNINQRADRDNNNGVWSTSQGIICGHCHIKVVGVRANVSCFLLVWGFVSRHADMLVHSQPIIIIMKFLSVWGISSVLWQYFFYIVLYALLGCHTSLISPA